MGITKLSLERIERAGIKPCKLLILGCQNLYNTEQYGHLAHAFYESRGFDVDSWDITGCQGSKVIDLREQQEGQYEVIFQHGTLEHMDGNIYMGFKNCHDLLKVGGIIIHENPKTGNWPGHGKYYFTEKFYKDLAKQNKYTLLELMEEPAMGNTTDGWNICAVIRKENDTPFMTEAKFNKLDLRDE